MDKEKAATLTIRLPKTLKTDAKTEAARQGISLTKVITDSLERFVEQSRAKPPPKQP